MAAVMNMTMTASSMPSYREKHMDKGTPIVKRNKSPMLADIKSGKKLKPSNYSSKMVRQEMSKTISNNAFDKTRKLHNDRSESINEDSLYLKTPIEERGGEIISGHQGILNINVKSKSKVGGVLDQSRSGNVSSNN